VQRADTNVTANGAETFPDVVARTLRASVKAAGTGRSGGKKLPDKHVSNPIAAPFAVLLTSSTIPALPKSGGTARSRGSGRVTTAWRKGYTHTETDPGAGAKKGAGKLAMPIEAERLRTLEHVLLTSNAGSHHKPLSGKVSGGGWRDGNDVTAHKGSAGQAHSAPGGTGSAGAGHNRGLANTLINERLQSVLLSGNDATDKTKGHLPLVGAGAGGATGLRQVAANPGTTAHKGPAGQAHSAPGGTGSAGAGHNSGLANTLMNERLQSMLLSGSDATDKTKGHLPLIGASAGGATGLRQVAANPGTTAQQAGRSGDYSQQNGTAPVPSAPVASGNGAHFAAIERSEIRLWRATGNGMALDLDHTTQKNHSRMPALGVVSAGGGLMGNPMYTVSPAAQIMTALQPYGDVQQFGNMLGKQLMTMLSNGNQQAILHLDPPQLGPLQVHLSTRQYNVSAWFVSAHADVRQALEAGMPALRYALAQQGVALTGGFIADQGQRQSFGDRTAPDRFATPFVALDEAGSGVTLQEISRTIPRWSAAGLSIYV